MSVYLNDETEAYESYYVLLSNSRFYGGFFSITKQANMHDGVLDVCLLRKGDIYTFFYFIIVVLFGRVPHNHRVCYYQVKSLRLSKSYPVHLDAEYLGNNPVEAVVVSKGLSLICYDS